MRHRLLTKAGKALYALRKSTVEPVIGIIKSILWLATVFFTRRRIGGLRVGDRMYGLEYKTIAPPNYKGMREENALSVAKTCTFPYH
jgi:hypothetical protein